jgi:vancomycin permeability regulator SanA
MNKIKVKEIFSRLKAYVQCQRTDLQPVFMGRLNRLIKEFDEEIEKK